jgi:hypothetical protein
VHRRRKEGSGRRHSQDDDGRELVGRSRDEIAVEAQDLPRLRGRVEHHAGLHDRADRVKTILERRDQPEVAAATAEPPEEVGVLLSAGAKAVAVGGDHIGRQDVVGGQSVAAHQPAEPSAERETRDAGMSDDPAGRGEPEGLSLAVELAPEKSRLRARRSRRRIDPQALHRREIDHEPAVTHRGAGDVVAAGSHGHEQIALACETDSGPDVGGAGAARDEPGTTIDRTVPDRAGGVVLRVAGTDELSTEVLRQFGEGRIVENGRRLGVES